MFTSRAAVISGWLDPDTQAYVAAIAANGGSISAAWARQVDRFIRGLKADGVWDSLLDVGLFVGVDNLNAALVKLKAPSGVQRVLTNFNFVSADYNASGASAGLNGNGSNKSLVTGVAQVSVTNAHLSAYVTFRPAQTGFRALISTTGTGGTVTGFGLYDNTGSGANSPNGGLSQNNNTVPAIGFNSSGYYVGAVLAGVASLFKNGTSILPVPTITDSLSTGGSYALFRKAETIGADISSSRISGYTIGTGLTAAQVSALSTRVNDLMRAAGANQY